MTATNYRLKNRDNRHFLLELERAILLALRVTSHKANSTYVAT